MRFFQWFVIFVMLLVAGCGKKPAVSTEGTEAGEGTTATGKVAVNRTRTPNVPDVSKLIGGAQQQTKEWERERAAREQADRKKNEERIAAQKKPQRKREEKPRSGTDTGKDRTPVAIQPESLQGKWTMVRFFGKPTDFPEFNRDKCKYVVTISKDQWEECLISKSVDLTLREGTIEIDDKKQPATIDLLSENKTLRTPGLFLLKDDSLTVALAREGKGRPKSLLPSADSIVMLFKRSSDDGKVVEGKPEPLPKTARKLIAAVNTAGESPDKAKDGASFNKYLKSVTVYATGSEVIIDCEVDVEKWLEVGVCYPLLVRLFDSEGEHLTHFVTEERFTGVKRIYENYDLMMRRIKQNVPESEWKKAGYFPPVLLKATGNRLRYRVSNQNLKDAAKAEVGFRRP